MTHNVIIVCIVLSICNNHTEGFGVAMYKISRMRYHNTSMHDLLGLGEGVGSVDYIHALGEGTVCTVDQILYC